MSDIVYLLPFSTDMDKAVKKTYLDTIFATNDNAAHQFSVQLMRGQNAVRLAAGATVSAYFIRYSDNATVPLKGSASGNIASVTLTKACYNKPGQFALIIKALEGGVVSTVFYGEGTVFASSTDTQVDEENIIPSLDDLLAQVAVMEKAIQEADAATAKIEGMTVSAEPAETAAAIITEVGGVKHITFKLQRGEKGEQGPQGIQGIQGNPGDPGKDGKDFAVMGMYVTLSALQAAHPTGSAGQAYAVGTSESNSVYLWDVDAGAWVNLGALQGPAGPKGEQGPQGKQGIQGIQGIQGEQGPAGATPVRGTDYWTDADKAQIVSDVLTALPNARGVNF